MACPSAVFSEANKFPTHNTHFEPYSPATFLRTRTSLNLDSQSTRETEPTPTPDPQRTLKDAVCFPSLKHRRGSSTALGLTGDRPLSKQFPPHIPTMSLGSEDGDTDDEDIRGVLDKYNIEGVSREDLKLWIQSAPEDQRLEMAHDIKLLPDAFEARYDTEGISREDLELWRELAPPDQRLEAGSDTDEIETNEMDCEPRSRTPGLRSLQEVAPTDARRASSNSIEQSKATQVNHFIRRHPFLQTSLVSHTTSERRSFERDIYDYARGLGLSIGEACKEVFKGRAFCGEDDYNSDDTALGNEVDDSAVTMRRLSTPVMSLLEQPQTHQMADVPAIVTAPRERKRRKKQSTVEPPANTKAENVVMEAEVSAAQRETINVPQGRLKSSEDISSKFFPNERELGKKRKRESADGANVQGQKKPKKETRKQKSNEVDNQAPASEQVDQSVLSAASLSNLEGNSKDRNISLNTQATPDDGVEEMKDTDAMDNKGEVTVNGKNREKRKRRKDKSKGPYGSTTVESAIGPENLSNVVAADEGSDHNAPATAKNSTSHTINESRQEQQSSASAKPAVSSDEGGANHILDLVAAKAARKVRRQERQRAEEEEEIETGEKEDAARKIRKQERRRAKKEKAKEATEKEDAAADLPPAAKINKPDESHEDFDNHPINQITGLPAPSVNELLGISGPNHELSRARTEPTTARGPNDPKSTTEARRNLLISAARDPIEHDMTAETNHEQHSQRTKKSEDADEGQADVEPPKKKKRRKRKSGADEEHADNEDGNENVKTEKVEPRPGFSISDDSVSVTAADEGVSTPKDENAALDGALDAVMAMLNKSRSGSAAGIGKLNASPLRAVVIEKSPLKIDHYPKLPSSAASSPLSSAPSSPVFSPVFPPLELESETDRFQLSSKTSEAGDDLSHRTRTSRRKSRAPSKSTTLQPPTTPSRKSPRKASAKRSPYFPKSPSEKVSCIPFPPLRATSFGLVQEQLSHDPFRLLIAVIFLNKTRGSVALPVFYNLMAHYPTPAALAAAKPEDLVPLIQHLGLQNQRAAICIKLAQAWLDGPPEKGKRYRRLHYPNKDDGKDIKPTDGPISDADQRVAWEVGHLPGIGAYAIDSWRIFCRDALRGLPHSLPAANTSPEARGRELDGEWTRVLPRDKELRAYLRWRWLRLGWTWDPLTGAREVAREEEMRVAEDGGVIREGDGGWAVEGEEGVCGGGKGQVVHGGGGLSELKECGVDEDGHDV